MFVKQNDETIKEFDIERIYTSIKEETNLTNNEARKVTFDVQKLLNHFKLKIVESGFIRTLTYQVMLECGCTNQKIGKYAPIYVPLSEFIKIDGHDSELTNDNANTGRSPESIHKKKADFVTKQQNLRMLPEYIESAHRSGDVHIHDLEYFNTRDFCADYDLRHTFYHGVSIDGNGSTSAICGPAMHPSVAVLHAIKIIGAGQVNSAGGQGFYNFLTFLAPYFSTLSDDEMKQELQMFIYECNTMLVARGGQAIFSSVQLTPGTPKLWWDRPVVAYGKVFDDWTYGELDGTVRKMFDIFFDIMLDGDDTGRPFSFPKPEADFKYEFYDRPECKELYKKVFELSLKYGSSYYDNEMTPKRKSQEGISCFQCCAYNFSIDPSKDPEFESKMNFENLHGFSMGASQVITINVPRLAFKSHNYDELKHKTKGLIKNIILPLFRIKDKYRKNMYRPFFEYPTKETGIFNTDDLSYVIGIIGINEVAEILEGIPITKSQDALEYIEWFNEYINELSLYEQFEENAKIALSRTPAETTGMRFAKLDIEKYGDKIKPYIKGDIESGAVYYTNGCMIPPEYEENLVQKIEIEGEYFKHISGGNIFHLFLGEAQPNLDGFSELMFNILTKSDIDYFAVSRDLTICKTCKHKHYSITETCSECSSEDVIRLARVTGYIQAIDGWNDGKLQELEERKRY